MRKLVSLIILTLGTLLCADAQVLGTGSVDSTKNKNVSVPAPKAELKAYENHPEKGVNQDPNHKKVETTPELAPVGKPKQEEE